MGELRCVAPVGDITGEGAVWAGNEGCLYWTDINRFLVHRLDGEGAVRTWFFDEPATALALTERAGTLVVALGSRLIEGEKRVRIFGEEVEVAARVHTLGGFSAHGDQEDLLRWHAGVGGEPHTYLVHGEAEGASGLCEALRVRGRQAEVAKPAQRVDLTSCGRR